jgi:hypothetical protein
MPTFKSHPLKHIHIHLPLQRCDPVVQVVDDGVHGIHMETSFTRARFKYSLSTTPFPISSQVGTTKGTGGDIVLEEAAYIDPNARPYPPQENSWGSK